MNCIECGERPKHKRYHRCSACVTWASSVTARKGILKRQQWRALHPYPHTEKEIARYESRKGC